MGTAGSQHFEMGMFLNMGTPQNEPPGDAPEGKVWSPEHGHWHDAG